MTDMFVNADDDELSFGKTVFDEEGNELGSIRGFDQHGFYVTVEGGIESMSDEHRTTGAAGQAELMWRCWECGEMGDIEEDIPDECPSCGAPKEEIYYWTED
ncbi:DUF7130 family rubredoxin-like protein [Haloarcula nitratireducens]|uniref:DUF7130 domain-containing protein n=1 Tax=Haloarcula nitratireducens TaxID=2487749 RepID=A0AAW4PD05_9EURY|nr:hypothetical protein [Halomicroarcula nitratireducens]MBX0295714.1 hypothetical protein [Halomicroarcula nitratireducens]